MVNLFMLVSFIIYQNRLTKSRYLRCALSIQLENISFVDKVATGINQGAIGEISGRNWLVIGDKIQGELSDC